MSVKPVDVRIEQRSDGGYHLFIRAKAGMGSVLLTETTKDPSGKKDNYAYRAESYNAVNGDERRMLDGSFIDKDQHLFSLIDSSAESDTQFGQAFHIFIPWVVAWGYSWSRNGRTFLADGTFINIRTFAKPYANYAGSFFENPYRISVTQAPFERPAAKTPEPVKPVLSPVSAPPITPPPPVLAAAATAPKPEPPQAPPRDLSLYMPETVSAFSSLADTSKGTTEYSVGKNDIIPALARILDSIPGPSVDLVICLDTTESMADDIDAIKTSLPPMLREKTARFRSFRLGLVAYKDYFEDYVVQKTPFTLDPEAFNSTLSKIRVQGGRDIPEAVYEALYEALSGYDWLAASKLIVLIGDAPPHPIPRAKIDRALVEKKAASLGVSVSVIILPH